MNTAAKTWLDVLKTTFQKVVHKATEGTGEEKLRRKQNCWENLKPKSVTEEFKKLCRNNYSTRKERRNIEWIKTSIIKWNTLKYLSY